MSIQYQTQVLPFVVTNFKGNLSPTKMTSSHTSPTCVGSYSTIKQFFIASLLIWLVHNFAFGNISPTRLRPASALSEETHDLLLIADVLLIAGHRDPPFFVGRVVSYVNRSSLPSQVPSSSFSPFHVYFSVFPVTGWTSDQGFTSVFASFPLLFSSSFFSSSAHLCPVYITIPLINLVHLQFKKICF